MAVHHIAGVEIRHAELVLDIWTVIDQLMHLPGHVSTLVKPHPVGTLVLAKKLKKNSYNLPNQVLLYMHLIT